MGLNRSIAVVLVLICGLSICIVSTQPVKAQSSQTITIKADGSVDPSMAAVRRDGDIYSLAGNIIDSITVQRDNIVLEGVGYMVQAKVDNLVGINIGGRSNVTVRNVKVQGFLGRAGILVDGSNNCVISQNNLAGNLIGVEISGMSSNNRIVENNLQNNSEGIELVSAFGGSDNIISGNDVANNNVGITISFFTNTNVFGNTLTGNKYGFFVGGGAGTIFSNNTLNGNTYGFHAFPIQGVDPLKTVTLDTSNTVNGKPVYYWVNQKDQTIPSNAGYVALVGCTGIAVQNLTLTGNAEGVFLGDTTNSTISHNTLSNNLYGVNVYASSGNTISENTVTNNENGVGLGSGSSNNSIYGNDITANSKGIFIDGSSGNNIIGNNVTNSATGIYTEYSGINIIYHNNFINNTKQWFDIVLEPFPNVEPISVSTWDNGTSGNYWSDYLTRYPNAKEIGNTGIGDTPYVFDTAQNGSATVYYQDNHPLMKPVSIAIPEFPSWIILQLLVIIVIGVSIFVYFKKRLRRKLDEFEKGFVLLLVLVLTASLTIGSLSVKAEPKTITVPDDYSTISAAIKSASDGDTIFVRSGNYTESVDVNKSISLIGEDRNTTIITAPSGGVFSGLTPIEVSANNVRISNLTINNYNVLGFGISISGNGTQIVGNTVYSQTGIFTRALFTTILENNISGYLVSVQIAASHCNITNNILSSNGDAVDLEGSSNIVSWNRITGHSTNYNIVGYGVLINGNSNSISGNIIDGETDGISVAFNGSYNVVTANSVANCSDTGLRIDRWDFNNTYSENNVTECKYGAGVALGAYNNTIYHNNFVSNVQQAFASQPGVFNYWNNGKEGNYWSDLSTRYPNATEIDSSGVWDTPYVINDNNTDNYPLTMPYGTSAPQPEKEPFPTLLIAIVFVVAISTVVVGVLVYFKKRKR